MGLDNESSVPLYKQLKEIIKEEISRGTYKRGQKIPPEVELQETYHISRITIRKALQELTDEKILELKRDFCSRCEVGTVDFQINEFYSDM